jgi:C4-dicarboxylate transporter, DctM subunit
MWKNLQLPFFIVACLMLIILSVWPTLSLALVD